MLKPIDIVVLGDLVIRPPDQEWTQSQLAQKLHLSQPSIHRSLRQLANSGLWRGQQPQRLAFERLIVHAVRFVYPAELAAPARGLPTGPEGAALSGQLVASQPYVWPMEEGTAFGPALLPLHPSVPQVAAEDRAFHELMALIDIFRVGRARECRLAERRLKEILESPP